MTSCYQLSSTIIDDVLKKATDFPVRQYMTQDDHKRVADVLQKEAVSA